MAQAVDRSSDRYYDLDNISCHLAFLSDLSDSRSAHDKLRLKWELTPRRTAINTHGTDLALATVRKQVLETRKPVAIRIFILYAPSCARKY